MHDAEMALIVFALNILGFYIRLCHASVLIVSSLKLPPPVVIS